MNKNIWELYTNSERGKNAISAFTITDELQSVEAVESKIKEIYPFCRDYLGGIEVDYIIDGFFLIEGSLSVDNLFPNENETATDYE